jgi:hypothetical protein
MSLFIGRGRLMLVVLAFLGLMVGIDGLLQAEWLRSLAGWAWFGSWGYVLVRGVPDFLFPQEWRDKIGRDLAAATSPATGSWPLTLVSVLIALACIVAAVGVLVVPMEDAALWNRGLGGLMQDIDEAIGEWGARLAMVALLGFCAYAAGKTAYVRFKS